MRTIRYVILLPVLAGCAAQVTSVLRAPPTWQFRAVAPHIGEEVSLPMLLARARSADIIVFGEQHDDPETHRAELALLDAVGHLGRPVILSLEMFERDVQPVLDDWLAERIDDGTFLERSRPWPRYAGDYQPMVELAKARGWPVIAANAPRAIASAVGRKGLAALDSVAANQRANAAREIECPDDDYRARFMEQMRSHAPGSGSTQPGDSLPTAIAERFYLAQCVKDETMAESIVRAMHTGSRDAIVVHYTGAFHSDFGQGTVARVKRRAPDAEVIVITAIPVRDPASAPIAGQFGRADFVIFTRRSPRAPGSRPDARSLP